MVKVKKRKENILGISSNCVGSGVSLFQNKKLVFAVNEERFTRIKLDEDYPHNSINWCLNEAKLSPEDIDEICYGFTNGMDQGLFITSMMNRIYEYSKDPEALKSICERIGNEARIDAEKKESFERETSKLFPNVPIHYCFHHQSHQAAAYMSSPFNEALIITSDGRGDFKSVTISKANPKGIEEVYNSFSWESLGNFYGRITYLCGFKPHRHEGKILGLSGHGDPEKAKSLIDKMVGIKDGKIYSCPGDFYRPFFTNYSEKLRKEASKFSREDLAAAAQEKLEEIVCQIVSDYASKTGLKNICVAGGTFANVKLNQKIRELPEVNDIFVYPNMGDDGICVGSVYYKLLTKDKIKSSKIKTLYLGPKISNKKLLAGLNEKGFRIEKPNNLYDKVIDLLKKQQAVALIQGRTEFGPRALGNRSILITPDSKLLCDSLNHRLDRSEFMPFAPAISSDLASRCLIGYNKSQFSSRHMVITYNVTPEFKKNSLGVIHVDNTVRPQVVFKEDNPFFYELLNKWYDKTGRLCLINTSYNLHEDPIVALEKDVIYTFEADAVDCLLFPPYLAYQKANKMRNEKVI